MRETFLTLAIAAGMVAFGSGLARLAVGHAGLAVAATASVPSSHSFKLVDATARPFSPAH